MFESLSRKRVFVYSTVTVLSLTVTFALYDGFRLRNKYLLGKKLDDMVLRGPSFDKEIRIADELKAIKSLYEKSKERLVDIKDKVKSEKDEIMSMMEMYLSKFKDKWREILKKNDNKSSDCSNSDRGFEKSSPLRSSDNAIKNVKLLIIGDSLVRGVGCYEHKHDFNSPILPKTIAKAISSTMNANVDWYCTGLIGAKAQDLITLLPQIKEDFISKHISDGDNLDVETAFVIVIICGMNDWKGMFENFPNGYGPVGYKQQLNKLIEATTRECEVPNCKVFLPAIPKSFAYKDANFIIKNYILGFFFSLFCDIWDVQKQQLSFEDAREKIAFIPEPDANCIKYTECAITGNLSSDGIHPSAKGYILYGLHIADHIVGSLNNVPIVYKR